MNVYGMRQFAIVAVVITACYLLFIAYSYSFRLDNMSLIPSLNVNSHRWFLSFFGGLAFGISSAVTMNENILINNVRYYSVLMITVAIFLIVRWWLDASLVAVIFAASSAVLWNSFCARILRQESSQNILMIVLLIVSFILSLLVFGFSSVIAEPERGFWQWLFGDLSVFRNLGSVQMVLVALIVCALTSAICLRPKQQSISILLFGIAVGLLGAVFFVGAVAASIATLMASKFKLTKSSYYVISGILAAAFVVSADSLPKLLVGGYSPYLLITTVVLMMPLIVFLQLTQTKTEYENVATKNKTLVVLEWLMLVILVSTTVLIFWHITKFAQGVI